MDWQYPGTATPMRTGTGVSPGLKLFGNIVVVVPAASLLLIAGTVLLIRRRPA
jgi:hypothetical protein